MVFLRVFNSLEVASSLLKYVSETGGAVVYRNICNAFQLTHRCLTQHLSTGPGRGLDEDASILLVYGRSGGTGEKLQEKDGRTGGSGARCNGTVPFGVKTKLCMDMRIFWNNSCLLKEKRSS